ncbi:MAG: FtsX-like permease family protein [Candidatus Latescibacteria bacterium]|nr:FtsX-like permease family protein [Candidatus Latescibacterota bacterium]
MKKIISYILTITIGMAFLIVALGPDRMNPILSTLFGVEKPEPLPPISVPGAEGVADRVLNNIPESDVEALIQRFAHFESRVPGYPGHEAAAQFITSEFKRFGLKDVENELFDVTTPVDRGGTLTLTDTGEQIPIHSMWPNLVKTSTVSPTSGRLIYGGDGEFASFDGQTLENAIVLMEFNSWNNWINAAMLGAQQIVFIEPDSTLTSQAEQKFLQVPNSVERFWISKKSGRKLQAQLRKQGEMNVVIQAQMPWKKHQAPNVLGWLPGTDPVLKNKTVVISAYYDAMSVVPALAPGAEMACSIAGLLQLAKYFAKFPAKHTVLFLASSGHHLGFRGICDFLGRHARKEEHFAKLMTEPLDIQLFIGLDLTSQNDEIGVWHNNVSSVYFKRFFTPFGRSFVTYAKAIAKRFGLDPDDALVDGINPKGGMSWTMYVPGKMIRTDGQTVMTAGLPALSLITVNDARFRVDTPLDTPEYVNIKSLTGQIRILAGVLDFGLNDADFIPSQPIDPKDNMRGLKGFVRTFPRRSITPDRPRPGAISSLRMGIDKSVKGVRRIYFDLADEKGEFYMPGISERRVDVQSYYVDPESGEITYAPNRGRQGKIYRGEFDMDWWITKKTRILFPCITTDFYDTVDPRYLTKLSRISLYGAGNTAPQEYGYAIGFGSDEPVGTIFTTPGERVKIAMRSGSTGVRYLLLNSQSAQSKEAARGTGFQTLTHGAFHRTSFQAAKDMWTLNEARMRELEQFSVENQRLKNLHTQAKYHLDEAEQAMQDKRWADFVKHTRAGMGIESRAYPDVKSTQNDVIRGVIFFMLLVIPCAYFVERLLFTFSDVRYQILGFGGVFVVIWIFLSQVHPAFELSNPFVILLAFVILALAIFVISIVSSRFNENIRRLRSAEVLLHETDVGRISASLAAFQLGIANMKKRRMRTVLTFITLVLLTFTVLSFTSIQSALEYHRLPLNTEGAYPGMLIRSKFWGALEESAYDYARINFEHVGTVAPRSWYMTRDKKAIPVEADTSRTKALGVLGVTPQEQHVTHIDTLLSTGRWFKPNEQACILSQKIAERLNIAPHEVGTAYIRLFGKHLRVIGLMDPEKLNTFYDLDEEPLTPADFQATGSEVVEEMTQTEQREQQGLEMPEVEIAPFDHLHPDAVIMVPYDFLRGIGSPLQSVAVRFNEDIDVEAHVKDYLSRLSVVLFAGIPDATGRINVSVYSSLGNTSMRGLANLFIPILVAALIVLNTMMGSVYERFREIGIYSAVGLAPLHIAFLFIAEACVYAVLGTVSGYLLGQAVAKLLLWYNLLEGFTLNYSAMSTVISSALVMLVVLLSSLYPARQASYMAVPDVTRRWKLPPPDGDRWEFEFPFTVGGRDVFGLSVFLVDYFQAHESEDMGNFITEGATFNAITTDTGQGYTLDTTVWLAPFDLGVSQTVHFEARPMGEFDIFSLILNIDRLSGDALSWQRVNQGFMNALRKQILIWRTVDPADKIRYREKGEQMLAGELVANEIVS